MRILIIEDKAQHILSAEKFANECGHDVVIVKSYDEASKEFLGFDRQADKPDKLPQKFDVVLTDLLMPASSIGLSDSSKFAGIEQPYGLNIILLAMSRGVKAIGLLSDGSHHDHPCSIALDGAGGYRGRPIKTGDVTLLCSTNGPSFSSFYDPAHVQYVPVGDPLDGAKDWMEFWLQLMNSRSPFDQL